MGKRILVVDDEVVVLAAVSNALKKTGYRIDTAGSAEEALDLLENTSYDVVITDLLMPDIDGLDLLERIHQLGVGAQMIMITGYPSVESALRAKQLGAFEYVTKPFTRQELLSVVVRAIRRCEGVLPTGVGSGRCAERLYFIPDHCWVQLEPDRTARVGLASVFAATVGEIVDLELPAEDQLLEQGRTCVIVRAEDGVEHYVHSPLSGRVLEVNRMVDRAPEWALRDPEGSGWLFRLDPRDAEREIQNLVESW